MENNLKTSVTELLTIFRGALLAVIPWLEKAKIKWRDDESYDDWDNIAQSLYENIVCSSLFGEIASEYSVAKYNFNYEDYISISFIEVKSKDNFEKRFAFISFQSMSSPLDSVKVAELSKENKVIGYTNLKSDSLEFVFVKNMNGKTEIVDSLEVTL